MAASLRDQPSITRADRLRERELLRYYRPRDDQNLLARRQGKADLYNNLSKKATSPDIALTALAQLVAIRLNVRSVLINVITKDTQYTISEGTKSTNLTDTRESEAEGDDLWIGCDSLDKKQTLCQQTIKLNGLPDGPNEFFVVPDLSKDERFSNIFYVAGPPYWRFYVGTPLTTRRGINIGALCALDDKPRAAITEEDQAFCATIAQTIMRHLEMNREVEEGKKGIRMSMGLNAFVEGKSWLAKEAQPPVSPLLDSEAPLHREDSIPSVSELSGSYLSSGQRSPVEDSSILMTSIGRPVGSSRPVSGGNEVLSTTPYRWDASHELSGYDSISEQTELLQDGSETGQFYRDRRGHEWTFARAANLLRESLDLHEHGGVVFFDTAVGFSYDSDSESASPTGAENYSADENETTASTPQKGNSPWRHSFGQTKLSSAATKSNFQSTLRSQRGQKKADVLGYSTSDSPLDTKITESQMDGFMPLTEKFLQKILKHYPRGGMWSFDEDGSVSTSEEELSMADNQQRSQKVQKNRSKHKGIEGKVLQNCFPGVRQLLFAPLWDAGLGRWFSACFCFSRSPYQIFSKETELSFLVAFGNSVMAEVSRLVTITADQQKGDFIGSISHELRSPLHGILASAEFLAETNCDNFQNSLIDTIDSCGRTLLDTINHVLDFSKINSFERNSRKPRISGCSRLNRRLSKAASAQLLPGDAPPLLNIYAITDVAAICEEVIEGVYAGQTYQDISSTDISDISAGTRGRTSERGLPSANRALLGGSGAQVTGKAVDVILDIDKGDFTFTTQPGAVRRIIMNVFGNALKYTEEGTIIVKLELHTLDGSSSTVTGQDDAIGKLLVLKVIDTGRGISSQYLRTRLFTPFAQENTLAPGTGLGLSMVRSITNMLGGSIDIRSQVGKGTEVKISLPLMRTPTSDTPVSTPSTTASMDRSQDDSISVLQAQASGTVVSMYGFDDSSNATGLSSPEIGRVLRHYISTWYGLEVLPSWPPSTLPDIIVVDERHLPALLSQGAQGTSIISLCSNSSRYGQSSVQNEGAGIVEFISKPFGPYKLARALRHCLERVKAIRGGLETAPKAARGSTAGADVDPLIREFEAATIMGDNEITPMYVQTNGKVTAAEAENAHMALGSSSDATLKDIDAQPDASDFPFPLQESDLKVSSAEASNDSMSGEDRNSGLTKRMTEPESLDRGDSTDEKTPSAVGKEDTTANAISGNFPTPGREARSPRLLLVDDNKINLRLLQTFMRKRKYKLVDSAEDGCMAVKAAEKQDDGYDIIFMDISMPIMDGFEATRAIRGLEASRREARLMAGDVSGSPSPALIIALTGLASSRDQSEALTSGVDLFMTKPVSFKEIGRLLDNWETDT